MDFTNKTIGEIVAEDFRTAAIFKKHGIDFCCRGGRTIEEACEKKKVMEKWYFENAKKLFLKFMEKWLEILNEHVEKVAIKPMKTRWGSCNYVKKYINLNTELIKRTPFEIEYVILHELTHLKYPNHGKGFYNYIERYMPNYKVAEKMLNAKHYY